MNAAESGQRPADTDKTAVKQWLQAGINGTDTLVFVVDILAAT